MAVIANAKIWSIILQMVLLVQYSQVDAIKIKRAPYAVQEVAQEFPSSAELGGYGGHWSEQLASAESSGAHFIKSRGSFGDGGSALFYPAMMGGGGGGLSGYGMHDSLVANSFETYQAYGKPLETSHLEHSGGKSISELQDEADSKFKTLVLESKYNQKLAEEKVEKLKKSYGYGTFGYEGYEYPIKAGPIDLGTHHGVDLGTTLDGGHDGKLKLPVQTVLITKTLGVKIPEPYPIKQEVPVPAPYPVPVPVHHYSGESYPSSSYSGDYSGGSDDQGKSSYHADESSIINKVVRYHENLPKTTEKLYGSASSNYVRYLPRPSSSSAYRTSGIRYSSSPKQSVYEF